MSITGDNWVWRQTSIGDDVGGPAVIFDVDGVLSDASVRQHLLEGWGDWDSFFDACDDDPRNIAMYRGANIPAIYIESGYY